MNFRMRLFSCSLSHVSLPHCVLDLEPQDLSHALAHYIENEGATIEMVS